MAVFPTRQNKSKPGPLKTTCQITKANLKILKALKKRKCHFQRNDRLTAIFSTTKNNQETMEEYLPKC